jgi:hypothetical protein
VLALVYPLVVLSAIIITGNHYVLDAVAGAAVLGVSFAANWGITPQAVPEAIAVSTRHSDDRRGA